MFEHVIQIDGNVVKINHYTNVKKIREDIIYKLLEDCVMLVRPKDITVIIQ